MSDKQNQQISIGVTGRMFTELSKFSAIVPAKVVSSPNISGGYIWTNVRLGQMYPRGYVWTDVQVSQT